MPRICIVKRSCYIYIGDMRADGEIEEGCHLLQIYYDGMVRPCGSYSGDIKLYKDSRRITNHERKRNSG
jgi:hypothetical protein